MGDLTPRTPTFTFSSTARTTLPLDVPTGTTDGDFMLAFFSIQNATDPGSQTDWNTIFTIGATALSWGVYWRLASSEPASYNFSHASARDAGIMIAVPGVDPTTPIITQTGNQQGTGNRAFDPINPGSGVEAVIMAFLAMTEGGPDQAVVSGTNCDSIVGQESSEAASGVNAGVAILQEYLASGGSFTPTYTIATTTLTRSGTISIALKPASGAPPQSGNIPRLTIASTPRAAGRTPGGVSRTIARIARPLVARTTARTAGGVTRPIPRITRPLVARTLTRTGANVKTVPRLSMVSISRTVARTPGATSRPIPRVTRPITARTLTRAPGGVTRNIPRLSRSLVARGVGRTPQGQSRSIPRLSRPLAPRGVGRTPGLTSRGAARLTIAVNSRSVARTPGGVSRMMARITRPIIARTIARTPGGASRPIPRQTRTVTARQVNRVAGGSSRPVPRLTLSVVARSMYNLSGGLLGSISRLTMNITGRPLGRTPGGVTRGIQPLTLVLSVNSVDRAPGPVSRTIPRRQMLITARVLTFPSGPALRAIPRLQFNAQARSLSAPAVSSSRGITRQEINILSRQLSLTPSAVERLVDRVLMQLQALGLSSSDGFRDVVLLGFSERTREVMFDEMEQLLELTVAYSEVTFAEMERAVLMRGTSMELSPLGKELYDPGPSTEPEVDPATWQASFDGGDTWEAPTDTEGGRPKWLVAGPDSDDPSDAVAVITQTTRPLLRVNDNPEVIVANGPYIYVVT